jgi:hypothetical protein
MLSELDAGLALGARETVATGRVLVSDSAWRRSRPWVIGWRIPESSGPGRGSRARTAGTRRISSSSASTAGRNSSRSISIVTAIAVRHSTTPRGPGCRFAPPIPRSRTRSRRRGRSRGCSSAPGRAFDAVPLLPGGSLRGAGRGPVRRDHLPPERRARPVRTASLGARLRRSPRSSWRRSAPARRRRDGAPACAGN